MKHKQYDKGRYCEKQRCHNRGTYMAGSYQASLASVLPCGGRFCPGRTDDRFGCPEDAVYEGVQEGWHR
eukprot:9507096-Ditylum_brightwellii.AAC.1